MVAAVHPAATAAIVSVGVITVSMVSILCSAAISLLIFMLMLRFKIFVALGTQTLELGALEACFVLEFVVHGNFSEREV